MRRVRVIDSHTGGEPTRIVLEGGPDLGDGPLAQRRERLREEHDGFRTAVVSEPRGWQAVVGGILCRPLERGSAAAVIFFDNAGMLGMCGHGTIGLLATLAHVGSIGPGLHHIETPVGVVAATLHEDGRVTVVNVPSRRKARGVEVEVPGRGAVRGDVAWGGNWFFLAESPGLAVELANVRALTAFAEDVRRALGRAGVTGDGGTEVDHVALFARSPTPGVDSRNFVLCPGGSYDRSPCGTGTSAKLACLHAEGALAPGQVWRQESITGSVFEASYELDGEGRVIPRLTGRAFVTAEATLLMDERDPLRWGIPRA
jgi:4-hydroxyproline epimerase